MQKILKLFCILVIFIAPFQTYAAPSNALDEEDFESYEVTEAPEVYDPLEPLNRKIYVFNDYFDIYFLEHIALFYRKGVPASARNSIRNFLINLSLPFSALNSFIQGKSDNGLATFSTFLINSTVGIGGIFNVSGEKGIRYKAEDFGQTLGHYGVGTGAYLVLPFLGPSSTRDLSGQLVDKSINPLEFNFLEIGGKQNLIDIRYRLALAALGGIDRRESLIEIIDDIRIDSFDPYATIRSAYFQKRLTDINN